MTVMFEETLIILSVLGICTPFMPGENPWLLMEGRAPRLLEKLKEPDFLSAFPMAATVQVCDLPPPSRCSQPGFGNSKGDEDIGTV